LNHSPSNLSVPATYSGYVSLKNLHLTMDYIVYLVWWLSSEWYVLLGGFCHPLGHDPIIDWELIIITMVLAVIMILQCCYRTLDLPLFQVYLKEPDGVVLLNMWNCWKCVCPSIWKSAVSALVFNPCDCYEIALRASCSAANTWHCLLFIKQPPSRGKINCLKIS